MNKKLGLALGLISTGIILYSCKKDKSIFNPTPVTITIPNSLPKTFPKPIPSNNQLTKEGIALGRMLFYDPILSGNNTQSCASCHQQEFAFTDGTNQFSKGITGALGHRNAMPIFNLLWNPNFFWDGRSSTLEIQALKPIVDPVEMNANLDDVLKKLNAHPKYPELFFKAFGSAVITKENLAKAITQFERIIISGDSKYDRVVKGTATFTDSELRGFLSFIGNDPDKDGDCIHCHVEGKTFTDFAFKNNGLDATPIDSGRFLVTRLPSDIGKFKTPSLRNIGLTAPYMHDGRFKTLDEVLDHYNTDFNKNTYLDPAMDSQAHGRLTTLTRKDIIAFLHTLTDSSLLINKEFSKPN
jgi:cytochrome c peroxidase